MTPGGFQDRRPARRPMRPVKQGQRGVVLFVALVVLIVMTLMVLGLMRSAVLELKIGGVAQNAEVLFSSAESATNAFINENNGRFSRDCLTATPALSCFTTLDSGGSRTSLGGTADPATRTATAAPKQYEQGSVVMAAVTITATQTACVDDAGVGSGHQIGSGLQAVHFNVEARSVGTGMGEATVHEGIKSPLPPGSCY